jgi:polyisoprenoid-binding protein YceI
MSSPRPGTRRSVPRSLVAVIVIVVAVAGVAGLAYLLGQSVPAAVSLDAGTVPTAPASSSPSAGPASSVASTAPIATSSTTAATSSAPASTSTAASSLDGTWTVDTSIGSFSAFTDSFVGYRVAEQLANVGATTAVGRTPNVKGTLTMAGTSITAVKITADLTTLSSDRPMRDGQLRGQALQTDQFPTATFDLTAPIQLGHLPADGETLKVAGTGNLTLHGVTKAVSIPLQVKLSGGVVTAVGSIGIAFADYAMTPPQSMMVLSVADTGTMELQLHFTHG